MSMVPVLIHTSMRLKECRICEICVQIVVVRAKEPDVCYLCQAENMGGSSERISFST